MNVQGWFPLGLTGLTFLHSSSCSPKDFQEFSPAPQFKSINSSVLSFLYSATVTSINDYWKTIALTRQTFAGKVMFLLFKMLSRLNIAFLPRSKHLLISWLQSPSAVILEPPKINSHCYPIYLPWSDGILVFWMLSFKPTFSLSSFTFIKKLFSSSSLSAIRVVSSAFWGYWYFSWQSWFQLMLHPVWHFAWCTLHMKLKDAYFLEGKLWPT